MTNADELLSFAHRLADAARPIARRYFKAQMQVELKSDSSPVTAADKEIEATLRRMIEQTFPTHGIVGEEGENWNETAEWVWVIDPIDGTRAFIAGRTSFTTLVALCRNQTPVLGIIDQPIKSQRWAGCDGMHTTYNGQESTVSPCSSPEQARLCTTSIPYFNAREAMMFSTLEKQCASVLLNQDAYGFGLLANGALDAVIEAHLKPYDFCALAPVVSGAGGIITDWRGKALSIQSAGDVLACATPALHTHMLNACRI